MKTEKQAEIYSEKKCREFFGEFMDKNGNFKTNQIYVRRNSFEKWYNEIIKSFGDDEVILDATPFLKDGVIIYGCGAMGAIYISFEVLEVKETSYDVKLSIYIESENGEKTWFCSSNVNDAPRYMRSVIGMLAINMSDYEDPMTLVYADQKKSKEFITAYGKRTASENFFSFFTSYVNVNVRINWLMQHPEVKKIKYINTEADKAIDMANLPPSSPTPRRKPEMRKIIDLNKIKIYVNEVEENQKVAKKITSKKKQRLIDCWDVRGHYRHYKNGNVIYIEPFQKGPKRNKREGNKVLKTYIV